MKKVLIIEDDPIIGHIYKTRLQKEGYNVEVCPDGQDGFYKIHEFKPDAVLLDLMLPKINGVEILKKIRVQAQFKTLPIFVFTNAYVPNMVEEVLKAGASGAFNKACVTPREIADALRKAMDEIAELAASHPAGAPATAASAVAPIHSPSPGNGPPGPAPLPPLGVATPGGGLEPGLIGASDLQSQSDLLRSFKSAGPEYLFSLRRATQDFIKTQEEPTRLACLLALYRKVHALSGAAGIVGLNYLATTTSSLEALLIELHHKPKNINASTIRTVAHSVDFIGDLLKTCDQGDPDLASAKILVVDDEVLSCRAILHAMEKAGLHAVTVESSQVALEQTTSTAYDLIFLDVIMPGLDGFDLCAQIRAESLNKKTPIIFVTSLNDFASRARSTLRGGTDLIAKPFLFIELGVKALTYVLRSKLARRQNESRSAA